MKKDLIFAPALILVAVALFMLRFTGMTAHIAISVVGLVVLVVYAIATKKDCRSNLFKTDGSSQPKLQTRLKLLTKA